LALTADIDAKQLRAIALADRRRLQIGEQFLPTAAAGGIEIEHGFAKIRDVSRCFVYFYPLRLRCGRVHVQATIDEIGDRIHTLSHRPIRKKGKTHVLGFGTRLKAARIVAERPIGEIAAKNGTRGRNMAGVERTIKEPHRRRWNDIDWPEQM